MEKILFEYDGLKITQDTLNPAGGICVEVSSFDQNVVVSQYVPAAQALGMTAKITTACFQFQNSKRPMIKRKKSDALDMGK